MRHDAHNQAQVKVAVYVSSVPTGISAAFSDLADWFECSGPILDWLGF